METTFALSRSLGLTDPLLVTCWSPAHRAPPEELRWRFSQTVFDDRDDRFFFSILW